MKDTIATLTQTGPTKSNMFKKSTVIGKLKNIYLKKFLKCKISKGQEGGKRCNTDKKHSQKTPDFSNKNPCSMACPYSLILSSFNRLVQFDYLLPSGNVLCHFSLVISSL